MDFYTRNELCVELADTDVNNWSLDAYLHAVNDGYEGIKQGERPSQEYIVKARNVVMKQITLAGYRLSDLLARALTGQSQTNDIEVD